MAMLNEMYPLRRDVFRVWVGERLVYDSHGEGAWPKPLIDPPAGWDERDAKGV